MSLISPLLHSCSLSGRNKPGWEQGGQSQALGTAPGTGQSQHSSRDTVCDPGALPNLLLSSHPAWECSVHLPWSTGVMAKGTSGAQNSRAALGQQELLLQEEPSCSSCSVQLLQLPDTFLHCWAWEEATHGCHVCKAM